MGTYWETMINYWILFATLVAIPVVMVFTVRLINLAVRVVNEFFNRMDKKY